MNSPLSAHLSPNAARALPPGRQRDLASLALRHLWHTVFDTCPSLAALFPPDGKRLLDPFLEHAGTLRLTMGWSLHLWLLKFLAEHHRVILDESIALEGMAAAARRWTSSDLTKDRCIIVAAPWGGRNAILAKKCSSVRDSAKVLRLTLSTAPRLSAPSFAAFKDFNPPAAVAWLDIPR